MSLKKQTKAYLYTLLAVFFWSTAASAFKIALHYVTPFILLFYSTLFSFIALFAILTVQGRISDLFRISRSQVFKAALLGFINPFFYYLVIFKAYSLLPGQIAMAINYGWPLALTLLSVPILKQTLSQVQLISIGISFSGAIVIAMGGGVGTFSELSKIGIVLVFFSTIIWALFWLLNARDGLDPLLKLFLGFGFGLLYATVFSPFFGGLSFPQPLALLPLAYIGLFEMGITFVLWLTALQISSSAARVGNLIYISPFLSLVFLWLIVGEEIHLSTFAGLFLIVGSILLQEIYPKNNLTPLKKRKSNV